MSKPFLHLLLLALAAAFSLLCPAQVPLLAQEAGGGRIYVANSGSDTVTVIGPGGEAPTVKTLAGFSKPWGVAVSPDGSLVCVTNSGAGSVSVIDTATDEVTVSGIGVGPEPRGIAVAPDGRVYVANYGGTTVSIIDPKRDFQVTNVSVGGGPEGVAAAANGMVYVSNSLDISLSIIRPSGLLPRIVSRPALDGLQPRGIAVSPDGDSVYVAAADAGFNLHVITGGGAVVHKVPIGAEDAAGDSPPAVAVTPDGTRVFVADTVGGAVSVVDPVSLQEVTRVPLPGASGVAVSRDGRRVYVTSHAGGSLAVIDAATNEVEANVAVGEAPIGVAVAP